MGLEALGSGAGRALKGLFPVAPMASQGAQRSGEGLGFEVGGAGVPEVRNESVCCTEGLTPSACQRSQNSK